MSNMRIATLLKNGVSMVETLVSLTLLGIFTFFMVLVNKMQSDQAELENMDSPEKVEQKVLVTNPQRPARNLSN